LVLFIPVFPPANSLVPSVQKPKDIAARSAALLQTGDLGGENLNASSPKESLLLLARAGDPNNPPWEQRVNNGRMFWCMMNDPNAAQSTWVWDDLKRWGWEETALTSSNIAQFQEPLSAAYAAYGISVSNDVGHGYLHENDVYDDNGREREVSSLYCPRG
jgi:hypothetical protein